MDTLILAHPSETAARAPAMNAWQARHGLDATAYQQTFDALVGQGYRLIDVSGYADGYTVRYTGIWERKSGPPWQARHGIRATQYQAVFDQLKGQGFRPIRLSFYAAPGGTQFAGLWHGGPAPAWEARHGLTGAQYQAEFDRLTRAGYRLIDVAGYEENGEARYAGIWEMSNGPAWQARHGLSAAAYQSEFDALTKLGYVLSKVVGYTVRGNVMYAAIWTMRPSIGWVGRHGINGADYQRAFDDQLYQGYQLLQVCGYATPSGPRFAGVWESMHYSYGALKEANDAANKFMAQYNVPGLSLAISNNGRLVYARALGLADKSVNAPLTVRHRMRIASVSKPITAVATMRLVQNGQLALTDRVFGQGARLGTTYGSKPYATDDKAITLDHLLTHLSGYQNTPNDPMFQEPSRDHASLIGWVLDNRNPTKTPGTDYTYLNFGYCLIGRIIEKVSGQSYASYVARAILAPAGITSMQIAGDTLAARATDEVVYYGQSGDDPYGMKVARMDAHGGWIATPIDLLRFLRVVDGRTAPPDLLSAATIQTMTMGTTVKPSYARGWAVDGAGNWDHNGALPGTLSLLRRRANGVGHAAIINTRKPPPAQDGMLDAFYKMMDDVTAKLGPLAPFDLFG